MISAVLRGGGAIDGYKTVIEFDDVQTLTMATEPCGCGEIFQHGSRTEIDDDGEVWGIWEWVKSHKCSGKRS